MSSSIWGADAEEFRPERWDNIKDVLNTQFFTFQHGTLMKRRILMSRTTSLYWPEIRRDRNESIACGVNWVVRIQESPWSSGGEIQLNYHETEEWVVFAYFKGRVKQGNAFTR
jgi:hypothetical protein